MIDLHCHALPGIDDGPATLAESIALVRAAAAQGTRTIVATPHVNTRFPNRAGVIARAVKELNEALAQAGVAVEIRPGAEIAMTALDQLDDADLTALALGGEGGTALLIECPFTPAVQGFAGAVTRLQERGRRIVLAHPERCAGFQLHPELLAQLIADGALASVTAASVAGRFGREARRLALEMLDAGLVHNFASDGHDGAGRPPAIAEPLRAAGLGEQLEWLTELVPAAILAGAPLPPRPDGPEPGGRAPADPAGRSGASQRTGLRGLWQRLRR